MSEYKHGAFATMESTRDYVPPKDVGTLPVYIGRAPVHQLADSAKKSGVPMLCSSFNDAARQLGYSDDWKNYGLCEPVWAHFKNSIRSIGPIIAINVLDPATHSDKMENTAGVTFIRGRAVLDAPDAIFSTVKVGAKGAEPVPDEGGEEIPADPETALASAEIDCSVAYSEDGLKLILTDNTGTLTAAVVHYQTSGANNVTAEDVVKVIRAAIPLVYQMFNRLPTILCAPEWGEDLKVLAALREASQLINAHWYAYVNSDLPATALVSDIDKAIAAKKAGDYASNIGSVLWPMAKKGGRIFHLSTLNTVTMQRVDYENGNVPYETPSNKPVDIDCLCLADGTPIMFDQTEANRLNAAGIDTVSFWEGKHVMWGPHTSLFEFGKEIDVRDQFDCTVRMMQYVCNLFQRKNGGEVDRPMKRSRVQTICNDFQADLDGLCNSGAALEAEVTFEESSNSLDDMVTGDFVFDLVQTTPPPAKSLTCRARYSVQGLTALYGGDDNG